MPREPETTEATEQSNRCSWCGGECDPAVGRFEDGDGNPLCESCWDGAE